VATREGFELVTIGSAGSAGGDGPDSANGHDGLEATFVPGAGMVCSSLRHRGRELLAQRGGVRAYAEQGSTMGIPLLYPWANRLSGFSFEGPAGPAELRKDSPLLKLGGNGLPIHGAIPGALPWELADTDAARAGHQVRARLSWTRPELLEIFPFPHLLELVARIESATLTVEVVLKADAQTPVPMSFGFHPYLTLPGTDRRTWEVELPVTRRLVLDERKIPTGASEPFTRTHFELAGSGWDDAFAGLEQPAVFAVSAGEQRLELEFLRGFSHAQVYSPPGEDFICFEPMTAPTNALVSGVDLRVVPPGGEFRAAFRLRAGAPG
jgi:aldose 1-epimerase